MTTTHIKSLPIFRLIDRAAEYFKDRPSYFEDLTGGLFLDKCPEDEWYDGQAVFCCGPAVKSEEGGEAYLHDTLSCYEWMARVLDPVVSRLGFAVEYGGCENMHFVSKINEEPVTAAEFDALWPAIRSALTVPGVMFTAGERSNE